MQTRIRLELDLPSDGTDSICVAVSGSYSSLLQFNKLCNLTQSVALAFDPPKPWPANNTGTTTDTEDTA